MDKYKNMKKHIYTLFFLGSLVAASKAHAQTILISTAAGNGTYGYAGDGTQATAAQLTAPDGVAVADSGKVFIAEGISNVVRKVKPNGVIITIAGTNTSGYSGDGGAASAAKLSMPSDVAVDTAGNVYIADFANNVIRKVNKLGIISTFAGTGTGGYSGDNGPANAAKLSAPKVIATDSLGNLYIADQGNYRIRKVSAAGIITTVAGTGTTGFSGDGNPATTAMISSPSGVAADRKGNIYFTDQLNNRIRKVSAAGVITTIAGTGTAGYSGNGGSALAA